MGTISEKALGRLNEMITEIENKDKMTAIDVILLRLFCKIRDDKALPWDKPFMAHCINVVSEKEYRGINRILLDEGEYITMKQLIEYNEKHGTNFRLSPILDTDDTETSRKKSSYIVVFYKTYEKKLTKAEIEEYMKGNSKFLFKVHKNEEGELVRTTFTLRYYKVFNTAYIYDGGTQFPQKMGRDIIDIHLPAEEIINKYVTKENIKLYDDGAGRCYYVPETDSIHLSQRKYFTSDTEYYRTMFHEMTHSTGVEKRLNRASLANYANEKPEHCREEVIAELGSLLLASEAGFTDKPSMDNSDNYILGWFNYFYSKPNELITAMFQAEKAKDYILWWEKSDLGVEAGNE